MKIKSDFITNSSSTSYIFLFNGKEAKDLFNIIKHLKMNFEMKEEILDEDVNAYDIISYMKQEKRIVEVITKKIDQLEKIILDYYELKKDVSLNQYYSNRIQLLENLVIRLKKFNNLGYFNCLEYDFQNDEGNKVGNLFGNKKIEIIDPLLVVLKMEGM